MTLKTTLDQWAEDLAQKAKTGTTLQESTDAFKAVTAYFAVQQKRPRKASDDDPDEPSSGFSFNGSDEVLHGSRSAKVRSGRNS